MLLVVALVASLAAAACGSSPSSESSGSSDDGARAAAVSASPSITKSLTGSSAESSDGSSAGSTRGSSGGREARSAVPAPTDAKIGSTPRRLRPVRIAIPAIGVDASMTDLGIATNGTIEVPKVPAQAGWLDTTPAPGQQGPAVVAGHVDSTTGPAVFYLLRTLSVGDAVVITRRDGSRVLFTVDGVRLYSKRAFPTREVYGPVPGPALRLITCGGDYVKAHGGYQGNVVVYAS